MLVFFFLLVNFCLWVLLCVQHLFVKKDTGLKLSWWPHLHYYCAIILKEFFHFFIFLYLVITFFIWNFTILLDLWHECSMCARLDECISLSLKTLRQCSNLHFSILNPASNYLFKFNSRNTRTRCEICSKLTINTPERHQASFCYLYC